MTTVQQLHVRDLKARLDQPDKTPLLLDVREPWEIQRCALDGAVHIPMGQIQTRLHELDPEKEIVVVCHHGLRSNMVASYLARNGFANLYNLSGGIDAWAREIDKDMAVY
jgi:rhodanese-related sulfurtransferase